MVAAQAVDNETYVRCLTCMRPTANKEGHWDSEYSGQRRLEVALPKRGLYAPTLKWTPNVGPYLEVFEEIPMTDSPISQ